MNFPDETFRAFISALAARQRILGEGGRIVLKNGFKPLTLPRSAGDVNGAVTLVPDVIASGTVVFATRIPLDDLKKVFTVEGGELEAGKSGKISIKII